MQSPPIDTDRKATHPPARFRSDTQRRTLPRLRQRRANQNEQLHPLLAQSCRPCQKRRDQASLRRPGDDRSTGSARKAARPSPLRKQQCHPMANRSEAPRSTHVASHRDSTCQAWNEYPRLESARRARLPARRSNIPLLINRHHLQGASCHDQPHRHPQRHAPLRRGHAIRLGNLHGHCRREVHSPIDPRCGLNQTYNEKTILSARPDPSDAPSSGNARSPVHDDRRPTLRPACGGNSDHRPVSRSLENTLSGNAKRRWTSLQVSGRVQSGSGGQAAEPPRAPGHLQLGKPRCAMAAPARPPPKVSSASPRPKSSAPSYPRRTPNKTRPT